MLDIQKIDHVGIRVRDKQRAISFYEALGFRLQSDTGFEQGHPVIMEHPCGVVLNLLGPANTAPGSNILMDVDAKYPGYTHIALRVPSLDDVRSFLAEHDIPVTGQFSFKGLKALFIRDPDRSVIEFDEYEGVQPRTRSSDEPDESTHG